MLPKLRRLNLKTDFKWVASGKKIETKYLKLFIRMGDNDIPRVGIANSSNFFPKATRRNRARRLAAAAFESIIRHLPSTINIVVLPKPGIFNVKSSDVLLDLEEGLKREKIIN